jgi:stage V sporulation protein SpoVS
MNLSGIGPNYLTRVAGSHMVVEGDLNVTNGLIRINSNTTFSDAGFAGPAEINIGPETAALRMHGTTIVESGVIFNGDGMFVNETSGGMVLESGVSLGTLELLNSGVLEIDQLAGIASVSGFENGASAIWSVDIGGYLAGSEHDLLMVSSEGSLLNGFLDVDLLDFGAGVFQPVIGDQFTILSSVGAIQGTFLDSPVTVVGEMQYHWDIIYNPHDVTLELVAISVPEPSSGLLLAIGSAIHLAGRRRRRDRCEPSENRNRVRVWPFGLAVTLLLTIGCGPDPAASSSHNSASAPSADVGGHTEAPLTVAANATPEEVAKAALVAIENRDHAELRRLVAVKKVQQDVEAITRGRAAFSGMVEQAVPTAVGAILSEINWLDVAGRTVDQVTINGSTAFVTVKGKRDGQEATRRLFLVRDDDRWRLVPSHR